MALCLQVLVQRLQKDILPKIESQIAELAKQDEPTEATKAISKQLKVTLLPACLLACHAFYQLTSVSGGNLHEVSLDVSANCLLHGQHIIQIMRTCNLCLILVI